MRIVFVAPLVQSITPKMRYGGVERLVQLLAPAIQAHAEVIVIAAPGSKIPGVEVIEAKPAVKQDFEERSLIEAALPFMFDRKTVFHDFSHSTCISGVSREIASIAHIWYDPFIMQPKRPQWNIAAISNWQAGRFSERYYGQRAEVIDPICTLTVPEARAEGNGQYLSLGNWSPQKGHLQAVRLAKAAGVPLTVAGPNENGYGQYYKEAVWRAARGKPKTTLHGQVPRRVARELLSSSTALIYAVSYEEGMGEAHSMKSVEAMLCGTPVVVYNRGAMSEVVDDGVTGLLADTPEEFVQAIHRVKSLDRSLVLAAAQKRWSVDVTVERLLPWYSDVLEGRRW